MGNEIEAKYSVDDFGAVRASLRSAGAAFLGAIRNLDEYFDAPDGVLQHSDRGLRIRRSECLEAPPGGCPLDLRPQVTYKGPRINGREQRVKVRREVQTHVDDADAVREILRGCGMEPQLVVEKRRSRWRLDGVVVELDELPVIGRFVEIEGDDEASVERVRERIGLPDEPITEPYLGLLGEACGGRGWPCRDITFEHCGACGRSR
jgi:adenylate cyclase class 2